MARLGTDFGVISAAVVPQVPSLGLSQNTPDFQLTLAEGARNLGRAVRAKAKRLGRRAVVLASSAFLRDLVRGRHLKPAPEREALDQRFIDLLKRGAVSEARAWFPEYGRALAAEMYGKPLATILGALQAMAEDGAECAGEQFGGCAQSSGSGNASIAVWRK